MPIRQVPACSVTVQVALSRFHDSAFSWIAMLLPTDAQTPTHQRSRRASAGAVLAHAATITGIGSSPGSRNPGNPHSYKIRQLFEAKSSVAGADHQPVGNLSTVFHGGSNPRSFGATLEQSKKGLKLVSATKVTA
jgi:hypothetical protein